MRVGRVEVDLGSRYKDGTIHYHGVDFAVAGTDVFGNTEPYVNWSALGNCTPDEARKYAQAIIDAANLAEGTLRIDAYFTYQEDPS